MRDQAEVADRPLVLPALGEVEHRLELVEAAEPIEEVEEIPVHGGRPVDHVAETHWPSFCDPTLHDTLEVGTRDRSPCQIREPRCSGEQTLHGCGIVRRLEIPAILLHDLHERLVVRLYPLQFGTLELDEAGKLRVGLHQTLPLLVDRIEPAEVVVVVLAREGSLAGSSEDLHDQAEEGDRLLNLEETSRPWSVDVQAHRLQRTLQVLYRRHFERGEEESDLVGVLHLTGVDQRADEIGDLSSNVNRVARHARNH